MEPLLCFQQTQQVQNRWGALRGAEFRDMQGQAQCKLHSSNQLQLWLIGQVSEYWNIMGFKLDPMDAHSKLQDYTYPSSLEGRVVKNCKR